MLKEGGGIRSTVFLNQPNTKAKIRFFSHKQHLKKFITHALFLRKLLKGVLHQYKEVNQKQGKQEI